MNDEEYLQLNETLTSGLLKEIQIILKGMSLKIDFYSVGHSSCVYIIEYPHKHKGKQISIISKKLKAYYKNSVDISHYKYERYFNISISRKKLIPIIRSSIIEKILN
jgi:hypothetical protein